MRPPGCRVFLSPSFPEARVFFFCLIRTFSCIGISLAERENSMTAFTTQLVLCALFPEFQWTVFIEIAKKITGTYFFCRAEQGIIEIKGSFEWSSSYFVFWCIWNKICSPANKWDIFKNYFLEKLLLRSVLKRISIQRM